MSDEPFRFQGLCIVNEEGWKCMKSYDFMSTKVKQRLQDSPFNICVACIATYCAYQDVSPLEAIIFFEDMIRKENANADKRWLVPPSF
jgi:hypothetical protein